MSEKKFEQWAVVELFGHSRIAGLVSEQVVGGCSFVRVDVPATKSDPPFTKLFGQGAIYAMSFVDRDIALAAAEEMRERPITVYNLADVSTESVKSILEYQENFQDD